MFSYHLLKFLLLQGSPKWNLTFTIQWGWAKIISGGSGNPEERRQVRKAEREKASLPPPAENYENLEWPI